MEKRNRIKLPNAAPFWKTVRFCFYLRSTIRLLYVPVATIYLAYFLACDTFPRSQYFEFFFLTAILLVVAAPSLVLLIRILGGRPGLSGLLAGGSVAREWRTQWDAIEVASARVQERCMQSSATFSLPNARRPTMGNENRHGFYNVPEDVLADIPKGPNFVSFGNVQNQPIQAVDAGSREAASQLVRHISSVVAGRLLGKELTFVVFKIQETDSIRLVFVTDVQGRQEHHGFNWLTLYLRIDGTMVTGFVESVRSFYLEESKLSSGLHFRGDEMRAKQISRLVWEAVVLASPLSILLAPRHWWYSIQELYDGRQSAWFFERYRPDAGDSVDLFLIGELGNGLQIEQGYMSRVESVRTNVVNEVQMVIGSFHGTNNRAA